MAIATPPEARAGRPDADDGALPSRRAAAPGDARPGPSAAFVVELAAFAGPLDLLITLLRDEQVDIYDIPIARIAEQFLLRVHELALNDAAEYLEMAARLLRIKAQMLLPRPNGEEDWEDPGAELVRRLLEYQQMREAVDVLERRAEARRGRFARAYLQPGVPASSPARLAVTLAELLGAVDRVLRMSRDPEIHDVVPRALDLEGAITRIRIILALRAVSRWRDVLAAPGEPWQILSTLLALCELARRGELRLDQPRPFAPLAITRDAAGEAA